MDKKLIGKVVKLVWQDKDRVLIKRGTILEMDKEFVTIKTEKATEMIPTNRVLRIEMRGGNNK